MYVSGQLSESDIVLVDVGTGYYIDMVRVVLLLTLTVKPANRYTVTPLWLYACRSCIDTGWVGDRLSGKPGNVRELTRRHWNIRKKSCQQKLLLLTSRLDLLCCINVKTVVGKPYIAFLRILLIIVNIFALIFTMYGSTDYHMLDIDNTT